MACVVMEEVVTGYSIPKILLRVLFLCLVAMVSGV